MKKYVPRLMSQDERSKTVFAIFQPMTFSNIRFIGYAMGNYQQLQTSIIRSIIRSVVFTILAAGLKFPILYAHLP